MIYLHLAYLNSGEQAIREVIFNNRKQLLKQNYNYPTIGLIGNSHENLYYGYLDNNLFKKNIGGVEMLITNLLDYKLKNISGNVIISSNKFTHSPTSHLYNLIGLLHNIDSVKIILSLPRQIDYLTYIWEFVKTKESNSSFETWAKEVIEQNQFAVNYFKTIQKFEALINTRNLHVVYNDYNNQDDLIKFYLKKFGIKNIRQLDLKLRKLYPKHSTLVNDNIISFVETIIEQKFLSGNKYISKRYLPIRIQE